MHRLFVVAFLLCATSAFGSTCLDCHTDESALKKLVVFKAPSGEEGVG